MEPEKAETGTEPTERPDSLGDAIDAAQDTQSKESHTPERAAAAPEPDLDSALALLEAHRDKIPAERLASLHPQMQQGFTRKMNYLQGLAEKIQTTATAQGAELPPGKTVMDLLTDDDPKAFENWQKGITEKTMAPVVDFVQKQEIAARVQEMSMVAQRDFPEVKANWPAIQEMIAGNPDYMALAAVGNWSGLPLVAQAAATHLEKEKLANENREIKKLLEANKVVRKTGASTSQAGGPPAGGSSAKIKNLDDAIAEAYVRATQAS